LNNVILLTCKELIDDAKLGCTEMVFKDICLEILAKAKLVLDERQFEELSSYVSDRLKEKMVCNSRNR
jgi:dsDNA-binding SOS-regulon protein